jgi:pyrroline-5-carboxylate reductase
MTGASQRLRLLQIGCGKMGGALLDGWLAADLLADSWIVDPGTARTGLPEHIQFCADASGIPAGFKPDIMLVAIKPQMLSEALPAYRACRHDAAVVSIVAGKPIAAFHELLGGDAPVIRTMPNTPAAVGRGVTACFAGPEVGAPQRAQVTALMQAVGKAVWLEDESQFDAVTGVSGSGPAYVFHLVEALAAAARAEGLSDALAMELARATVEGAGELLFRSDESAEQLRRNVTSPKGTTEAGLKQLMAEAGGLNDLMTRTVAAAAGRSRELAKDS